MKILYTENEMLSLGTIYDYSPGIIIVGNIYDKTRTVFTAEGQLWRKVGEIGQLGKNESLYQWECKHEFEYARAASVRGDLVAVTATKVYWVFSRKALPGLHIPVYRKVIETEPTKYFLWKEPQVQVCLSTEEVAALSWVKY